MATYAIGDVQGCYRMLEGLLERIAFDPAKDRLWLVGDLVNRGPDNRSVLRWAINNERAITAVLGNHDLHLIARHLGATGARRRDTLDDVLQASDRSLLVEWLRHRPLLHHQDRWVLVHAGLLPEWTVAEAEGHAREVEAALQGEGAVELLRALKKRVPRRFKPSLTGPERWTTILQGFTVLRMIDQNGLPNLSYAGSVDDAPKGDRPWFELPSRREPGTTVLFGHWAALGLHLGENAIGLDTGAVWGNVLTALRLEDGALFHQR